MEIRNRGEYQRALDDWTGGTIIKPFDWKAYNNSQTKEKSFFISFLTDLLNVLDEKECNGPGRKPKSSAHMIFCMCMKIYQKTSSRRLISDLEIAKRMNYISSVPHFNSVLNYFGNKSLTRELRYLVRLSALPLIQIEKTFSIDASGISENKYLPRWSHVRSKFEKHKQYKKIHAICGNYSNIIADVIITDGEKADSPQFKELLKNVAENFDPKEVMADMGYLSRSNMKFADDLGITPFIPFKKNSISNSKGALIWSKMHKWFHNNPEEYGDHYHLRSNIETVFSMIEKRFGNFVMTKNQISQINEILCMALCHNICVLVQEIFISKIEIDFNSLIEKFPAQY
tara:strand:+ start:1183 stop:2211 length:1029 start_codon:yes stop_codon:yes gene_type:complete